MRKVEVVCDLCGESAAELHKVTSELTVLKENDAPRLKRRLEHYDLLAGDWVHNMSKVYGLCFECCPVCLGRIEGFVAGLKK